MPTVPALRLPEPKAPSMPTSTGSPASRPGLTERKVPVHEQNGTVMENRWLRADGGGGQGSSVPAGTGPLPPLPAPHGSPSAARPSTSSLSQRAGLSPAPASSAAPASKSAKPSPTVSSSPPPKGFCHMTGGTSPLPTGHAAFDKLRHLPTGALVKRAKAALSSGKVKSFVHHAAHHVARALHDGADAATFGAFVGHHYGQEGMKHASKIAVHAVGHHAARLKSLASQGVDEALMHLHAFGHDPLVHLGHAALAHHERKHAQLSKQYHELRDAHLAMLHDTTKTHKGFHDAAVEHTQAKAAIKGIHPKKVTKEQRARIENSTRAMKRELLKAGKLGHVNRSLERMHKLRAQVEHHVASHKELSQGMDRYHDRVLDHLESRGQGHSQGRIDGGQF